MVDPSPPPASPLGSLLVIDDEAMMVRAIQRLLAGEYELVSTTDPAEAIERIRRGDRFDAILCDLMMPAVSGMAVYESIRRIDAAQARRIVFMTGGAFTPRALEFLASVANPCVEKPLDRISLRAALQALAPKS